MKKAKLLSFDQLTARAVLSALIETMIEKFAERLRKPLATEMGRNRYDGVVLVRQMFATIRRAVDNVEERMIAKARRKNKKRRKS